MVGLRCSFSCCAMCASAQQSVSQTISQPITGEPSFASVFFKLLGMFDDATSLQYLKASIEKTFGKKKDRAVVDNNIRGVENWLAHLVHVDFPVAEWAALASDPAEAHPELPVFVSGIQRRMLSQQGNTLPVSAFNPDGATPDHCQVREAREGPVHRVLGPERLQPVQSVRVLFPSGWLLLFPNGLWLVTGWASVHTLGRMASLKLKGIFGRREGCQICPHQFCSRLCVSALVHPSLPADPQRGEGCAGGEDAGAEGEGRWQGHEVPAAGVPHRLYGL